MKKRSRLFLFAVFQADPVVLSAVDAPVLDAAHGLSAADLHRFALWLNALDRNYRRILGGLVDQLRRRRRAQALGNLIGYVLHLAFEIRTRAACRCEPLMQRHSHLV